MKFIINIAGNKHEVTADRLDDAIDEAIVLGSSLLANNQRMAVYAAECGEKVEIFTKRHGMDHWNHPGWQFGQVEKREWFA